MRKSVSVVFVCVCVCVVRVHMHTCVFTSVSVYMDNDASNADGRVTVQALDSASGPWFGGLEVEWISDSVLI